MRVNDVLELDIVSSGMDGEGVARVDGYVIFVPYALVGERVTARIVHLKKSFGYAEIVNILVPSKGRIKPLCRVYPRCGGCDLQHADRTVEETIKRDKVVSCLKKAGFDVEVDDVASGEKRYGYRNKLQLPFGTKDKRAVLGFYMKDSHNVVPTTTCPLHGEWADKLIAIRAFSPETRFFSGDTVAITNAMPVTSTLNSRISSTMPLAVPPPRRKSSTIRAFWFSRTARRLRLIISMLPEPDT